MAAAIAQLKPRICDHLAANRRRRRRSIGLTPSRWHRPRAPIAGEQFCYRHISVALVAARAAGVEPATDDC